MRPMQSRTRALPTTPPMMDVVAGPELCFFSSAGSVLLAGNVPEGAATVGRAAVVEGSAVPVPVGECVAVPVAVPVGVAVPLGTTDAVALGTVS